ncbi:MAG TPA: PAS domain-containing protein, partial [Thermodesulfobacteriota bacterium]|nr:PAS domain-containing protein [Thermodesulfobacteriota bacterium]
NLLIYMGGELQKKIIPLFHYALNPAGFLFLGTSETVGVFSDLFTALDRKLKLYQRREVFSVDRPGSGRFLPLRVDKGAFPQAAGKTPGKGKLPLREMTERALLQQYAPVGALVNDQGDILYLHGRTGLYLEPAPGETGTSNIFKMVREGLRGDLTRALHQALAGAEIVRCPILRVKSNGNVITVQMTVRPVPAGADTILSAVPEKAGGQTNLFLVVFEESSTELPVEAEKPGTAETGPAAPESASEGGRIAALKRELRAKEEYLQSTNEELETSNEELKSSNEEMQSVNEELQSTNEELETSKEELQSVNEELAVVNAELQTKVADLSRANNDMNNLLAGTGIGTVFVDHQLRILRFTPAVTQVINLILTDVGRPVGHVVSNLAGYDRLVADVESVMDTLVPKEVEVQTRAGDWFQLHIRPYRTLENVIEGAVITFTEINLLKKTEAALRESEVLSRLALVARDSRDAVTMQDFQGRILAWNPAAQRMYGWTEAEALSMNMREMVPEGGRKEALALLRRLSRAEVLEPSRLERLAKDGQIVAVWVTATALVNESGDPYAVATTERKIG